MKNLNVILILEILILICMISFSKGELSDKVDVEDWQETEEVLDGSYWVIELISNVKNDDIYDIIVESESPLDFIILNNESIEDYKQGKAFEYNEDYSKLNDNEYQESIPIKQNDESIILLIDNSDRVEKGAESTEKCEVSVWISPRKDLHMSFEELQNTFLFNLLIFSVIGINISVLGFLINKKRKSSKLEDLISSSSGLSDSFISKLENAIFQKEKDQLLEELQKSSSMSLEEVKKKYYNTQMYLTTIHYEKKGIICLKFSILISYIAAFYYSLIRTVHYVGVQEFSDYIIFWSGLGLLVIGIIFFIIGCLLLEQAWTNFDMTEITIRRINFFFLLYILTQIITIIYTYYVVNFLYGPWGGFFFPCIVVIISFYFRQRLINKIKRKQYSTNYSSISTPSSTQSPIANNHIFGTQHVYESSTNQNIYNLNLNPNPSQKLLPSDAFNRVSQPFKYCTLCGTKNVSSNKFCKNCGNALRF